MAQPVFFEQCSFKQKASDILLGFGLYLGPGLFVKFSVFVVIGTVFFGNAADYSAGIPGSNDPVWNILCNYTSGTYDGIASDMYSGENDRVASNPYIISDGHTDAIFIKCISCVRMHRMACRIDGNIGRDLAVVSNNDFCHINNRAVVIHKQVFSHFNVASIVTVKGRIDKCPF